MNFLSPGPADTLTFSLYGAGSSFFSLHPSTGVISLTAALDYEESFQYTLTIRVSDGRGGLATTSLTVSVNNVNDPPVFQGTPFTTTVSENVPDGTSVLQIKATDEDSSDTLSYSLSGTNSSHFQVSSSTGLILTAQEPDYEVLNYYSLTVSVSDGTTTVSQPLTITVADANDSPVFLDAPYSVQINENDASASVLRVNASDADNNTLHFTLAGSGSTHFSIHPQTGLISLAQGLDFEDIIMYVLTLIVTDGEGGVNTTSVTVEVINQNDAPVFASAPYAAAIDENIDTGTQVVLASASDEDSNDTLVYSLSGANSSHFTISATGVISTDSVIDYESSSSYSLTILVSDGTVSVSTLLTITVNDINDAPAFTSTPYAVTLNEGTASSVSVFQVSASDEDSDSIVFSFVGITSSDFTINSVSGEISTATLLDFETTPSYVLTVQAFDGNGRKTLSTVTVTITDINDETPTFNSASYNGHVTENVAIGSSIMTVIASDGDVADTSLAYSLSGSNSSHFSITSNGLIQTATNIDYEAVQVYSLTLTATDNANNTGTTTLIISVINAVDNDPVFSSSSFSASVSEDSIPGTSVIRVTASDDDLSDVITYTISGTDNSNYQELNHLIMQL